VHPLAAAVIEAGGAAPDRVTFYAGSAPGGTPTLRLLKDYAAGTQISVDNKTYGFLPGFVIVVAPEQPGSDCSLAQISGISADSDGPLLDIAQDQAYRYNSGGLGLTYPRGAARVFNLGSADNLSFHTWSVSDGYLQLKATGLGGSSNTPATVADNIVSLKAQYGFDTRAGAAFQPTAGLRVGTWSATIIDADGSGVVGDAGDYQRLAAVRLAVVARGKNVEHVAAGATCTSTSAKPVVFAAAEPAGVTAVPLTVDVGVAGDSVDWRCYRYRVFETVVTLRNASWRP
jgi:type IV pilus assembly protein PilW